MRRALSIALALAVCTAWSAAHAAGKAYTLKELREIKALLEPAAKQLAPVQKTISMRVQEATDSGAKFVKNLATIGTGVATGSAALLGWYWTLKDHPNDSGRGDHPNDSQDNHE
jgi:hypothetical protein